MSKKARVEKLLGHNQEIGGKAGGKPELMTEPPNLTTEEQVASNKEELLKTYSRISKLLERGQPFSKHELGDICESVVERGFRKSGLRFFIAYRDNQQGSHPDFVVFIWYKHQFLVIAIECHNYHLHYPNAKDRARKNCTNKFESLNVKPDLKVVFGSFIYTKPSRQLIKSHGIQIWDTPNVMTHKVTYDWCTKLFIAYILKWITDMTSEVYRETQKSCTYNLLDSDMLSMSRVNNRFPYPSDKVMHEHLEDAENL